MAAQSGQTQPPWWETGVIYQIYPLTFADGNGDGVGDLRGIIDRLDYLNDGNPDSETALGIDAIWLSPIYKSPMVDSTYDVSDYTDIWPTFGTLDDFDELLAAAHQRGIKIILDLVINHSSSEHPWFVESASSRDNPKADWYLWQDPVPGQDYPNNWLSYFGGPGWTYCPDREQFYYHTFHKNQPDLNWQSPDLRAAVFDVIRFWLDRGVDGFRLDASSAYSKDPQFRNNPMKYGATSQNNYKNYHHHYNKNLPANHQIIQEIRALLDSYGDRALIGETFIDNQMYDSISFYGAEGDEMHLPLEFEFPLCAWFPGDLQRAMEKKERLTPTFAQPNYFLDNHDIPRHLSRWVECSLCIDPATIARAAAALLLTVRGTPILYYGQELGMVDNDDIPEDRLRDQVIVISDTDDTPPSRDGSRTPMQWDASAQAGFSFGKEVEPWLPVHANYKELNVEAELADPDSILSFYRRLIRLRRDSPALLWGSWRSLLHYPLEYLAYLREWEDETLLVVINFSYEQPFDCDRTITPDGWVVRLSTDRPEGKTVDLPKTLRPFEVSIYQQS